jgi:hypothetical protein
MSRRHTKHVRAKWESMTEGERDASVLRGLRATWKINEMSPRYAEDRKKGAQRIVAALDRAIARLEGSNG